MPAVTVSTTPVRLNTGVGKLLIQNQHASIDIFVGPRSDVAASGASRGIRILSGSDLTLFVNADRAWYAVAASSNADVITEVVA